MTRDERHAIRTLMALLKTVTSANPNDLDSPAYVRGHQTAAERAIKTLAFIIDPPTKKDLRRYAQQPTR